MLVCVGPSRGSCCPSQSLGSQVSCCPWSATSEEAAEPSQRALQSSQLRGWGWGRVLGNQWPWSCEHWEPQTVLGSRRSLRTWWGQTPLAEIPAPFAPQRSGQRCSGSVREASVSLCLPCSPSSLPSPAGAELPVAAPPLRCHSSSVPAIPPHHCCRGDQGPEGPWGNPARGSLQPGKERTCRKPLRGLSPGMGERVQSRG